MSYGSMGREIEVKSIDTLVSSTNTRGEITYVNDEFCRISGFKRKQLVGKQHNIVRHPDMPKCIFKYMWDNLLNGKSVYAFIKNKTKKGDYYWVKAYLEPVVANGIVESIYSYKKQVNNYAKSTIESIYRDLSEYEKTHSVDSSLSYFKSYLEDRNLTYNMFIDRLSEQKVVTNLEAMQIDFQEYYNDHVIFRSHITHRVDLGEKNVKVVDSCSCRFGKWLKSVENESYTKHQSWSKVHKAHNHVHEQLSNYVEQADKGASAGTLEEILKEVGHDTEIIFNSLTDVIDHCE